MSGWEVVLFATVFAFALGVFVAVKEYRRDVRPELYRTADREPWGTRPSWTQVGALEFVRYGRAVGGARWELERVIFEDTPAGRLAAKRFEMEENVTGPKVLHTRDKGGR